VSRGAALTGALLVTLASPATWPLALAAFLVRGGILVVAIPIVVLPTPVGLGNILAPLLTSFVFGGVSAGFVVLIATIVLAGLVWVVAGGVLAATLEAEAAWTVAADDRVAPPVPVQVSHLPSAASARIFAVRVLAHLPLGVALAWGSARLVATTYRELTNPIDVATPIVWRVLRESPEVVAAIVLTWMAGQAVGAIAARRITLGGVGVRRAVGQALRAVIRRPLTVLIDFWLPTLVLALVIAPSALAAASAADIVRAAMSAPADPAGLFLAVVLLVALWILELVLIGMICAWRAAVWTVGFGEPSR
jgi:hypothetical protein